MNRYITALIIMVCLLPAWADASPGQSGSSGLLNVSSGETLDAGNICIGVWSCYAENSATFSQKNSMIVPVTITLGIGTFWEVYGAYPNIFFNGDEDSSGRGTLDLGTKLRFWGGRSSDLKLAVDLVGQQHISESRKIDGATDISAKLVASYNNNDFGIHVTAGYLKPDPIEGVKLDSEYIMGLGIEYMAMTRLKLMGEAVGATNRYNLEDRNLRGTAEIDRVPVSKSSGRSLEASFGVQYYLSPHLTLNSSISKGFGNIDADFRFLFGLSSCQGAGTYVKEIPAVGRRAAAKDKTKEALKPLKIIPISSLLLKASAPRVSPVSKLEVEVGADAEEILIKPYGQIVIAPQQASSNLTSPVIPVEIPLKERDEDIALQPLKTLDLEASAIDYTMNRIKGVTQLYGVDVKGSQVAIPAAAALPERMTVYRKFSFPDVTFDAGQWAPSSEGRKMLSEVAEQIRKDKKWLYIKIDGHTDGVGSLSYNMDLSLKRAVAIATYLISNEGVSSTKIFVKGLGKSAPIAENNTAAGRSKNRRTEIMFLVPKEGF